MTASTLPSTSAIDVKPKRRRLRWIDIQENLTGYLFVAPALLILIVFGFFPIGYDVYMSLYNWRVKKTNFIGLDNYTKAVGNWTGVLLFVLGCFLLFVTYLLWTAAFRTRRMHLIGRLGGVVTVAAGLGLFTYGWSMMEKTGDKGFLNSLPVTLYYALGTVPAEIILAIVLAYILFQNLKGKQIFRVIFFLPYVLPLVATATVFTIIFSPDEYSLANRFLEAIGLHPLKWLYEPNPAVNVLFGLKIPITSFWAGPSLALVSMILFGIWTYVGYNTVIFLAGLGSIPHELYEAAQIDGAGQWQLFRFITIPMLSPVTFYLTVVAFIGTLKAFNHIYVMKVPNAQSTVNVASVYIFQTFYQQNQYGYAAAQAILLFLIILGLTYFNNKAMGSRVFYG